MQVLALAEALREPLKAEAVACAEKLESRDGEAVADAQPDDVGVVAEDSVAAALPVAARCLRSGRRAAAINGHRGSSSGDGCSRVVRYR